MSEGRPVPTGRKLKLRQRAERMDETRRCIARATYELHATVGPALTTISAVAERAGVQRATVYHHFPRERELHQACVEYAVSLDPPPDPQAWRLIADPTMRLRLGLAQLYGYFRRNEALLTNVSRDVALVLERLGGEPPAALAGFLAIPALLRDALAQDCDSPANAPLLAAVLLLAVDFGTWQTLVRRQGLDDDQVVELMARVADCAPFAGLAVRINTPVPAAAPAEEQPVVV
jgi:AcrR family transcriptional regulator